MKRFFLVFAVFCLWFAASCAEELVKYRIDEMDVEVSIPKNNIVFQRGKKSKESDLNLMGMTESDIQQRFIDNNIYITIISTDREILTDIALEKNDHQDLNQFTIDEINTLIDGLVQYDVENGISVNESKIYRAKHISYIELNESISENRRISFFSSKNGITIHVYSCATEDYYNQINFEDKLISIVDSIRFTDRGGIRYIDDEFGFGFELPTGWREIEFNKEDSNFKAKFISEDGEKIQYMRADMWANIPDAYKKGFTRKDVDNSILSATDIADMYGGSAENVKMKKYGKNEYYIFDSQITTSNEKMTFNDTFATTVQDGYIISFVFFDSEEHPLYKDFEYVLESLNVN